MKDAVKIKAKMARLSSSSFDDIEALRHLINKKTFLALLGSLKGLASDRFFEIFTRKPINMAFKRKTEMLRATWHCTPGRSYRGRKGGHN